MRRLSWPCGGAGLGGLTMSDEGGLEEVEESLRAAASCWPSWATTCLRAASSASRTSTLAWSVRQLVQRTVSLALMRQILHAQQRWNYNGERARSIYDLWRQVLEYFDATIVGLTATPSKQTYGFFNQNLVMEYDHEQAVADGVNVGFDVYRIRTQITEHGSAVNAGFYVDRRDRLTRKVRWEQLDEEFKYTPNQLDRDVVAKDQIRTIIQTFRDRLFTEIFPGRTEVPKTLIFAKDDSHADDIVQIIREEFGKGNDFAQKITYRTGAAKVRVKKTDKDGNEYEVDEWVSGNIKPEDMLSQFRTAYNPRIAVTVDMIATGTDIKPLEIVMFMRAVKSRTMFEQMKGRGSRVVTPTELQNVTPDGRYKDHFVIIDAVGLEPEKMQDTQPLERKKNVGLEKLFELVTFGNREEDVLSSIAA